MAERLTSRVNNHEGMSPALIRDQCPKIAITRIYDRPGNYGHPQDSNSDPRALISSNKP